ncbi:MAG TPA: 4Fe-4S dicluster domain-containing protein [Anaerolineae bacterium]|nr:4Fe-4S dicluster domain-containing protein [Anaerolineae bacterium]
MREILIRDLGKCINCNVCVDACRNRHGRARMTMTGAVFGQYQLPDVCRNCPDQPCVTACHLDGMHLHDGNTFVSDACRGCNKCVEACPYEVITLLPREHQKREGFFKRVVSQARGAGHGQAASKVDGRVAADATRCVQCGICGYNCPVGIQVREYAREGKIVDDPRCVKCGLCIEKCPRGTLRWESPEGEQPARAPMPLLRADKCDLCKGYGESACVKECPTNAMLRLPADERLRELNEDLFESVMERARGNGTGHSHNGNGNGNGTGKGHSAPITLVV